MRRIGVLMNRTADNPQGRPDIAAFLQGPATIGLERRPQRADRYPLGYERHRPQREYAAELVALIPDVILASGTLSVAALQHVTHTLPIVFVRVVDPVGAGFVDNLLGQAATLPALCCSNIV